MQSNAKQSRAKQSKANTERGQVKEKPPNWGRAGFIFDNVPDWFGMQKGGPRTPPMPPPPLAKYQKTY